MAIEVKTFHEFSQKRQALFNEKKNLLENRERFANSELGEHKEYIKTAMENYKKLVSEITKSLDKEISYIQTKINNCRFFIIKNVDKNDFNPTMFNKYGKVIEIRTKCRLEKSYYDAIFVMFAEDDEYSEVDIKRTDKNDELKNGIGFKGEFICGSFEEYKQIKFSHSEYITKGSEIIYGDWRMHNGEWNYSTSTIV